MVAESTAETLILARAMGCVVKILRDLFIEYKPKEV